MAVVPSLYIVAGPIGNLKDITLRALQTLQGVEAVLCEDTRHTGRLMQAHGIKRRLISCHAHNQQRAAERALELLDQGFDLAYLSDAGTPGVSDPGARLVEVVRGAGHPVIPIPGASALTALLSVSSFGGKTVVFEGFLPRKRGKRAKRLRELLEEAAQAQQVVFYESPHRIIAVLEEIAEIDPSRPVLLGREMTKLHEEYVEGSALEVLERLRGKNSLKGECSLLVSAAKKH